MAKRLRNTRRPIPEMSSTYVYRRIEEDFPAARQEKYQPLVDRGVVRVEKGNSEIKKKGAACSGCWERQCWPYGGKEDIKKDDRAQDPWERPYQVIRAKWIGTCHRRVSTRTGLRGFMKIFSSSIERNSLKDEDWIHTYKELMVAKEALGVSTDVRRTRSRNILVELKAVVIGGDVALTIKEIIGDRVCVSSLQSRVSV